jgi:hypothetical protein
MNMTRRTVAKALFVSAAGGLLLDRDSRARGADASKAAEEIIRTEVCVIGAGSGGTAAALAAALAAARAGAKVVLLERDSVLGGTATNGLVCVWRPVIGAKGIPLDLFREIRKDPLGVSPSIEYERTLLGPGTIQGKQVKQTSVPFEPRAMDYAVRSLLEATGRCQTLLATTFCRARMENDTLKSVDAWFAGKRMRIEADVFIDCTGDGDVCVDAGCEYRLGEDPKKPRPRRSVRYTLPLLVASGRKEPSGRQPRGGIFAHRRVLVPLAAHVDYAGASGRQCRCVGCEAPRRSARYRHRRIASPAAIARRGPPWISPRRFAAEHSP